MWLLQIDSFSNWLKVMEMTDTSAIATISKLKQIFAAQGLPEQIMSDVGLQFIASEFKEYCGSRGILHTTTAPYHPLRSNGEVERLVETFKSSLILLQERKFKIILPIFLLDIKLPLIQSQVCLNLACCSLV